ncbi:hypothetical protein DF268_28170 [Streptomyces sp. V2]|uniref:DUF6086 family protein n=1 Tax=Streptomyces TaxID=1883 RepID=UPI0006EBD57E|nr:MULTISPECIES: DUF6086 family protein [Streptomyces]PWG10208.1 hypothetical protein DF268_28170 [Streptomyces sp. V2]
MSQYFEIDGESLWNPSNGASRLFLAHVRLYESKLGIPSGFGEMTDDECAIDVTLFGAFVRALLDRHARTSHSIIDALSEGFVATVVALAGRAGVDVTVPEPSHGLNGRTDVQVPLLDDRARAQRLLERAEFLRWRMSA